MAKKEKRALTSELDLLPLIHNTLRGLRNDLVDLGDQTLRHQASVDRSLDRIAGALEAIASRTPDREYLAEAAVRALSLARAGQLTPPSVPTPIHPEAVQVTDMGTDVPADLSHFFTACDHSIICQAAVRETVRLLKLPTEETATLVAIVDQYAGRSGMGPTRVALAVRDLALAGADLGTIRQHFTVPTASTRAALVTCPQCQGSGSDVLTGNRDTAGPGRCWQCDGEGVLAVTPPDSPPPAPSPTPEAEPTEPTSRRAHPWRLPMPSPEPVSTPVVDLGESVTASDDDQRSVAAPDSDLPSSAVASEAVPATSAAQVPPAAPKRRGRPPRQHVTQGPVKSSTAVDDPTVIPVPTVPAAPPREPTAAELEHEGRIAAGFNDARERARARTQQRRQERAAVPAGPAVVHPIVVASIPPTAAATAPVPG